MSISLPIGTYGFRFNQSSYFHLPMCQLFAVGYDIVQSEHYRWDGMERTDGPQLLFQYTVSGEGILVLDQEIINLRAGMAFLVEIPSQHSYYYSAAAKQPWEFIFIQMRPQSIMPIWNEVVERIGKVAPLPKDSLPLKQLEAIYWAAREGKITDPFTASSFVYSFMMELRKFADSNSILSTMPLSIITAVKWMDENYTNMISQEQLADHVGLSKYHFNRSFAKYVGITPNEYVKRKRIEVSLELLLSTDYSLEEIAQRVGYSSASYYIRMFRKLIGQTPATFRSQKHQLNYKRLYFD